MGENHGIHLSKPYQPSLMTQLVRQQRRSEFTLMIEVLQNTVEPVKKTNLAYQTRLNFQELDKYLSFLMSKNLVGSISKPFNGYQITQKGTRFIELLDEK